MKRRYFHIASYAAPIACLAMIAKTGDATFMAFPLTLLLGLNGGYDLNNWVKRS